MKEDLRAIAHNLISGWLAVLLPSAFAVVVGIVEPWRNKALEFASIPLPCGWALLAVLAVVGVSAVREKRLRRKLTQAEQKASDMKAGLEEVEQKHAKNEEARKHRIKPPRQPGWVNSWRQP